MTTTCPWCREPLGFRQRKADQCPHCDRPLSDEEGQELRAIDLRYEQVEVRLWERWKRMLVIGGPVVAVVLVGLPLLHLGAVAMAPLFALVHLIVVRMYLLRKPQSLLGPRRRLFVRWLGRLVFLWVGVPGYALAAVPLAGLVPGLITYGGLTTAAWAYLRWSLAEERDRAPLSRWEKWLLIGLVTLSIVVLVVLLVLGTAAGLSVAALQNWLAAD